MKITAVETHVCHARMRNWVFVKVVTDQPGLFGWGEATLEWHTRAVVGAVEDLAELLVGEDPTRIEHLWQMMYRQHFWHGHGIVRGTAIAGIDLALWDILGKVRGVPCQKLWGGPVRDYVRTYCHLGGGKMEDFYETARRARSGSPTSPGRRSRRASPRSSRWPCRRRCRSKGSKPIRHAESVRRARCARPSATASTSWSTATPGRRPRWGMQFAKALEPYGLYFFEEPCWPESVDGLADDSARRCSTPIATGERLSTSRRSATCSTPARASVVQLDITHCGGLTEARRIAALAEAHRIALAPHNPQGPVSTAASLEFGFATPSYIICETVTPTCRGARTWCRRGFTVEPKGRSSRPNDRPGLGIEINEAECREAPVPAGAAAARVLLRRQRRGLVAKARQATGSSATSAAVAIDAASMPYSA